jgi:hypothetical protein
MTLRFAVLALPLALAACGGQIDGSVFAAGDDAAIGNDATGDDASVVPADASPVEPDATPIVPDTTLPPIDSGKPALGADGTPCSSNAQCASNHCFNGRCASTCNSAADCVSGWYCSQTTGGKFCRCTPAGNDCGGLDKNCDGVVSSNAPCAPPPPVDAGPAPTCTSCAQSACGSQAQSCYFDATCKSFLTCAQACGTYTGTCVNQCATKNNDAATQSLLSCMATNCAGCT